jgi:hypothetical protein
MSAVISCTLSTRRLCARIGAALVLLMLAAPASRAGNVTWTLNGSGDWDTAANWSSSPNLPGPLDNVEDNANYTITHSTGNDTVASFNSNGELILSGGTLSVTGNLKVNSELYFDGGMLANATVQQAIPGSLVFAYNVDNILNDVSLYGGLNLAGTVSGVDGGWAHLTGGTTLGPSPTITIATDSFLSFDNAKAETVDGASINFTDDNGTMAIEGGESLTLGPNSVVTATAGAGPNYYNFICGSYYTPGTSTLINEGTITSAASGQLGAALMLGFGDSGSPGINPITGLGTLTNLTNAAGATISASGSYASLAIGPVNFTNSGAILASGGAYLSITPTNFTNSGTIQAEDGNITILPTNAWTPSGTILATGGGEVTINIKNAWVPSCTIQANGVDAYNYPSIVQLGGTLSLPSNASSFLTTSGGGVIEIIGTLDLTGDVAGMVTNLDPTTVFGPASRFGLDGGTIDGGTITHSSSLLFAQWPSENTLDGVALDGGLNLSGSVGSATTGGYAHLTGGTTFGPNPTIDVGYNGLISFDNAKSEALNGATIDLTVSYATLVIEGGETLTLGPTTVVNSSSSYYSNYIVGAYYTPGASTLINDGTITASGSLTIGAADIDTLTSTEALTNFTNAAGATISVSGAGSSITVETVNAANAGNILAGNDAGVFIEPTAFTPGGVILASGGAVVCIQPADPWTPAGTIQANGTDSKNNPSILELGGPLTLPLNDASIVNSSGGGLIELTGTLDLTGELAGMMVNFDHTSAFGGTSNFAMAGGTLRGGGVGTVSNSSSLLFAYGLENTLSGVTLDGGLNLNTSFYGGGGWGVLAGGTKLGPNPTIALGTSSLLCFDSGISETLNGAAIDFLGSNGNVAVEGGETLTFGPATVANATASGDTNYIGGAYYTSGTSTLINTGTIVSASGGSLVVGAGNVGGKLTYLTNAAGGTISSSGAGSTITIDPTSFTNAAGATISASGSGATVTIDPASFTNHGSILASGGALVTVAPTAAWGLDGTVQANGMASNTPSTVQLDGTLSIPSSANNGLSTSGGGAIELAGTLDLAGDVAGAKTHFDPIADVGGTSNFVLYNGTIMGNGVGTISHSSGLGFAFQENNTLKGVALTGGLNLNTDINAGGGWAHLTGGTTLASNATIDMGICSLLSFDNGRSDTLNGATINILGAESDIAIEGGETLTLGPGTVVTVNVSSRDSDISGNYYTQGTSTLINDGAIAVASGDLNIGHGFWAGQLANVTNGATGVMSASGSTSNIYINAGTLNNLGELLTTNGGEITVVPTNAFTNAGMIDAEAGGFIALPDGAGQSAGQIVANGTIATASSGTINIAGGKVTGAGTIQASLANTGGVVAAGSPTGTLALTGTYTQGAGGTLLADIGGSGAGTGYSVFAVGGAASLGGTIEVDFVDGFVPTPGETFDVMTYSSVTGGFQNVVADDFSNFQVDVLPGYVQIQIMPTPGPDGLLVSGLGLGAIPLVLRRRQRSNRTKKMDCR